MKKLMLQILKDEVKPATGCTEPVAVALAVAEAKKYFSEKLGEPIREQECVLKVKVSPNLFKNGLGVGIPNCGSRGLHIAAALGLWACDPTDGLTVFEKMTADKVESALNWVSSSNLELDILDTAEKVRVEVMLIWHVHQLELVINKTHDHVEWVALDKKKEMISGLDSVEENLDKKPFYELSLTTLIDHATSMDPADITFLKDGLTMNRGVAEAGLGESCGMGVGYGLHQCVEEGELGDDLMTRAMYLTAAASDARMSGLNMTVMSSNGSGNNGLTAILPLVAYSEMHEVDEADLLHALALSHLLNCYVKERIGRLSAMCSCAISAATGSGAAIAWLMTKNNKVVLSTIQNMTGNLAGMICDGAKEGCAMKLATGAGTGVQAAMLAKHGVVMPSMNGIVGRSAEESIEHLGRLSQEGMQLTDGVILDMMQSMMA